MTAAAGGGAPAADAVAAAPVASPAAAAEDSEKAAELRRLQAGECEKDRHAGSFAVLSVQDTGCGMTEEVASRVFEPFFSTKGKHEKTGLGLASVYNIVRTHKGFVDIQTRPGCGTTFLVYLPVVG